MQSIIEVLELTGGSLDESRIKSTNTVVKAAGLLGRPIAADTTNVVPVFEYDSQINKFTLSNIKNKGLYLGSFSGVQIVETFDIDQEGVSCENSIVALIKDPIDKKVFYGLPINSEDEISNISDVMIDLEEHPIAQEAEAILAQENIDLFSLAACYRGLNFKNDLEHAQFTIHAQYLFRPIDLCNSISTYAKYISKDSDIRYVYDSATTLVGNNSLAFFDNANGQVSLVFSEDLSDFCVSQQFIKVIYLNESFQAYTKH